MKKKILITILIVSAVIAIHLIIRPNPFKEYGQMPASSIKTLGQLNTVAPDKNCLYFSSETKNFIFHNITPYINGTDKIDYNNGGVIIIPKKWYWGLSVTIMNSKTFGDKVDRYKKR